MQNPRDPQRGAGMEVAEAATSHEDATAGDFAVILPATREATVVVVGRAFAEDGRAERVAALVIETVTSFARYSSDPHELLTLANAAVLADDPASATGATATCAAYDPRSRGLRWASAGLPPRSVHDGRRLTADSGSAHLGVSGAPVLLTGVQHLDAGTGLLLASGDLGGTHPSSDETRVLASVRALRAGPALGLAHGIAQAVTGEARVAGATLRVIVLRGVDAVPAPSPGAARRERQLAAGGAFS